MEWKNGLGNYVPQYLVEIESKQLDFQSIMENIPPLIWAASSVQLRGREYSE